MLYRLRKSAQMFRQPRTLAVTGVLLAMNIILGGLLRIQITPQLRMGISFITTAATAMLFGPVAAVPAAAVGDILALALNPSGGYFFGFTVTAMMGALLYSVVLFDRAAPQHDKQTTMGHGRALFDRADRYLLLRAFAAKALVSLVCNVLLNSLWMSILYGDAFAVLLPARLLKNAALLIPETLVLFFALKAAMLAWRQIDRVMR
jgi:ECF transporter S component (folate family)